MLLLLTDSGRALDQARTVVSFGHRLLEFERANAQAMVTYIYGGICL